MKEENNIVEIPVNDIRKGILYKRLTEDLTDHAVEILNSCQDSRKHCLLIHYTRLEAFREAVYYLTFTRNYHEGYKFLYKRVKEIVEEMEKL